jgi:hypothetical protein
MTKMAAFFFSGALSLAAAGQQTFTGVITDTMCGKDHTAMGISPNPKCVRDCVKHDKNSKYALLVGDKVYVLSDQQTPEKFAGEKVKVSGVLYEKTKIIKVEGIEPAR